MCGRYASARRDADLAGAFRVSELVGDDSGPSWNVAPMQPIRVVLERPPRDQPEATPLRQLRRVRWGLVPSWAKDAKIGARMINARSETLTEKPAFKAAAAKRRCLVPMDGYFEWQSNEDKTRTP
jgi:putative SOS response-associated peptidase YedK